MIRDLKEGPVTIKALITKADMSRNTKGTPYLSLNLEDSSGMVDAKFWNLTEEQCASYHPGQIVEVKGDLIYYRNVPQLRVRSMNELEGEKLFDYVREAPISSSQMQKEIDELVTSIEDPILFELVFSLLDENREAFFSYPAAVRNHHNYVGGLAYHTLSMARMIEPLKEYYPFLNRDLLVAGALLHDLGKIREYTQAVLPEYSVEGNLLGHISMMAAQIDKRAHELGYQDSEQAMLLKHMVLSHHGKQEYGSPVLPMIPEAEVLAQLDNLDARMEMMKQSVAQSRPGTFGPRLFALENRMIYHRMFGDEQDVREEEPSRKEEQA